MIWIITSNCKKLSDPTPELVLTYKEIKIPMLDQDRYIFNIFSNVRKSELTDSGNNVFRFQCNNSSDLNTQIKLLSQFLRLKIDGSDIIDDLTIVIHRSIKLSLRKLMRNWLNFKKENLPLW